MNYLIKELENLENFRHYIKDIKANISPITVSGLSDVGKIQQIYGTFCYTDKKVCIVTYNELQAKKIVKDLAYFTDDILFIPKKELFAYDYVAGSKEVLYKRIEALNKLYEGDFKVAVMTVETLMQKIISKEALYKKVLDFEVGKSYDLEQVKKDLVSLGYDRIDMIETKGQFSVRGGILDISLEEDSGVRVEFWGDEVDSIRRFDIVTQRSNDTLEKVKIYPAHELLLIDDVDIICNRILESDLKIKLLRTDLSEGIKIDLSDKSVKQEYYDKVKSFMKEDIESIKNGNYISKVDKYFNSIYMEAEYLYNYFDKDTIFMYDELEKVEQRRANIVKENNNLIKTLIEKEKKVPDSILNLTNYEYNVDNIKVYLEKYDLGIASKNNKSIYNFKYRDVNYYKSELDLMFSDIEDSLKQQKKVIMIVGNFVEVEKFQTLFDEKNIESTYMKNIEDKDTIEMKNRVIITEGLLHTGFECYDMNVMVIAGEELFGEVAKKKKVSSVSYRQGEKIVFADLKIGDYVVHKSQGIGQFIGVNTIKADGIVKDYIKIRYKNDDVLYVPTNSLDNIRKHVGQGESAPKINRLGSKEWTNTKTKVKNSLRAVAQELIELYAKRQKIKGFAFSKDTPWQRQFEEVFPYKETDDQLRCIREAKEDMERERPMDRLLCGDVGYGKTEVAIRTAFKAVMDQKQVAYLVPTTVLANQQFESFRERMKDFPINVEVLNRFRTKKEQEDIIRRLALGEIDILVGTHRILSKDVEFKDLGLLIIDEEHRFGVKDKEKIKQFKNSVDVLSMSATPIPRTLHMSILGVRDMSVIYEPPHNRKQVQTYVLEYDDEIIKEAITKELERDGQIYYLYNKVDGIEKKAEYIEQLVPEAKVAYAHGKMTGSQLEDIMQEFIDKKVNVLVCTTILESGIDIPNANTIIVENADRLGLAQLYQIRGRVGRSDKQAYAFVTYKRDKLLTEVADKRLKAIKEFTEFGSGFKIAMRDLEIRGAGSLLGEIQHGHMEQVGYDTYCSLLDEVVKEMQGIETIEEMEIQIELNISSYIPDTYIQNGSQKIEIYQDIALCRVEEDIQNVTDEIIDRYGTMPVQVENLLEVARIKERCKRANVVKVSQRIDSIVFIFDTGKFNFDVIPKLLEKYNNKLKFSPLRESQINLKVENISDKKVIREIKDFLEICYDISEELKKDKDEKKKIED